MKSDQIQPKLFKDLLYIRFIDLPRDQEEPFMKWIIGQTCPVIDGDFNCAYYWDYDKWYKAWVINKSAPIYD